MAFSFLLVSLLVCCGYSCADDFFDERSGSGDAIHRYNVSASNCSNATDNYCIDAALTNFSNVSSSIILESGVHRLKHFHSFADLDYFQLAGEKGFARPTVHCEGNAGLAFLNVTNAIVENIEFINCGFSGHDAAQEYVDEYLVTTYFTPESVEVVIFAVLCHDFLLRDVYIGDTTGIGFLSYNTRGSLELDSVQSSTTHPPCVCIPDIGDFTDAALFNTSLGGGAVVIYEGYRSTTETERLLRRHN